MPRAASPNQKSSWSFSYWLLLLVVVNLAARLPLCWDPATVDNDGAEYLAITRHLRTTGQYATDLKWQFFTDGPVRHLAWADRPPLYPYLALLHQRALPFLNPVAAARVGNAGLACLGLVLCAVYLRRLFGDRTALFATGFSFLLPHTLKWTTQPMTETVTLTLLFAALLVWDSGADGLERSPSSGQRQAGLHRRTWGAPGAFLCGILSGLTYLARPTGALLLLVLLADQLRLAQRGAAKSDLARAAPDHLKTLALIAGFALCALPYHLLLRHLYGNPFYSALGFTFAVRTYYEVSYYGFEAPKTTTLKFLHVHLLAVPGLILHQAWRHVQILIPQLLPFLPFALTLRKPDWSGRRWPGVALIAGTLLVHTLTWSAWGSSRYFLTCLPLMIAFLLAACERTRGENAALAWLHRYARIVPGVATMGLAVCLGVFYATYARADRGLQELPAWKEAAREVRAAGLIASDKPSILNLLLSTPAVRLPRTTDAAQLERFIAAYHPDVLVLFADEPAERPMADTWRAGQLPKGWYLARDQETLLIARPSTREPRLGSSRSVN